MLQPVHEAVLDVDDQSDECGQEVDEGRTGAGELVEDAGGEQPVRLREAFVLCAAEREYLDAPEVRGGARPVGGG